jgi:hypothetical protein
MMLILALLFRRDETALTLIADPPEPTPAPLPDPVPNPLPDPYPQPIPEPQPSPLPSPVPEITARAVNWLALQQRLSTINPDFRACNVASGI